ncbi:MAG TPA: hypothetical protein VKP69_30680 [Isosphaeraceae bacterium]|nr:hypothetical protein [Isosphaeraceae bacterium]
MAKRRQFTPEFQSQAEACRNHGLGPNLVALWKAAFVERAHLVFDSDSARSAEQARIAELEQVLGRVTLENEILILLYPGLDSSQRILGQFLPSPTFHGGDPLWIGDSTPGCGRC